MIRHLIASRFAALSRYRRRGTPRDAARAPS